MIVNLHLGMANRGIFRTSITSLAWLAFCLPALAAEYVITATVGEILHADLSPSGLLPSNTTDQPGVARVYRVDFTLQAQGFDAVADQRGFGNILFDISSTGPNLKARTVLGSKWQADTSVTPDLNGATAGGIFPIWDVNADDGQADDLQFIFASVDVIAATSAIDPRQTLGAGAGTLLGSVYYEWSGIGAAVVNVSPRVTSSGPQVSFARISNGQLAIDAGATVAGEQLGLFASADFNENGTVDSNDLAIWQENYFSTQTVSWNHGDANGNGFVDGADFLLWQRQYRGETPSGIGTVPEPEIERLLIVAFAFVIHAWRAVSDRT